MKFEKISRMNFNRKIGNMIKIVKNQRDQCEPKPKYSDIIKESRCYNVKFERKMYQVFITVGVSSSTAPVDYELFED